MYICASPRTLTRGPPPHVGAIRAKRGPPPLGDQRRAGYGALGAIGPPVSTPCRRTSIHRDT